MLIAVVSYPSFLRSKTGSCVYQRVNSMVIVCN
jgi:hypothetical protein